MTTKPTNVAIIGYGLSAKIFHIPLVLALPDSYNLHSILQRSPSSTNSAANDHPSVKHHTTIDTILSDPAIDLIIITTPPETHYPLAHAALTAHKNVVVEKPFVPTSSEGTLLIDLAKSVGKILTVYQNRRWDQDFLTLQKVLASGSLGEVVDFETHYDRYRPTLPPREERTWKNHPLPAGGALFDLGSHLLDQVWVLFGAPRRVTGWVGVLKRGVAEGESAPDYCTVVLEYGDERERMVVTVKSSSLSAEEEQLRFWVRGTKGSYKKHYLDVQEDQLKAGGKLTDQGFGQEPESHYGTISLAEGDGSKKQTYPSVEPTLYVEYYKILAQALNGKGDVPVKAEDAANVLKIIEMAQESSKTGRTLDW